MNDGSYFKLLIYKYDAHTLALESTVFSQLQIQVIILTLPFTKKYISLVCENSDMTQILVALIYLHHPKAQKLLYR